MPAAALISNIMKNCSKRLGIALLQGLSGPCECVFRGVKMNSSGNEMMNVASPRPFKMRQRIF